MIEIDKMAGASVTPANVKPVGNGDVQVPDTRTWWQKLFGAARSRNATVAFADSRAKPVPPVPAPGIALATTRAVIVAALRDPNSPERIELSVSTIAPRITLQQATQTAARANDLLAKTYEVRSGTTKISLRAQQLVATFRTTATNDTLELTIDTKALRAVINGRLDSASSPPTDAKFRVAANGSVEIVPSQDGQGPDIDHIATEILAGHTTITAPLTSSHPARDTAWAKSLGIIERVSSFTSHHPCCPARVTNIHKAADYLNGAVIEPGEVFSLNDLVGARTQDRGFVSAPVFYGEFTEDFGGGVSQLATTTFNAAFWGGFEIVAHKPHSIYFDRYPMGREATVNYPSLDLKWRNDSKHGVLVTARYNNNDITVALYGDREGKRVRETTEGCSIGPIFDTRDDPRCINILATFEIEESELTCPVKNPANDPNNKCATLAANARATGAAGHKGYSVEYFRTITVEGQPPKVQRFSWRYRMLSNIVLIGDPDQEPEVTTTTSGATTTSANGGAGSTTTAAPPPKATTSTTSG